MELRSARTYIRPWRRQDDDAADEWPPYNDPLEPLWNIPRQFTASAGGWYSSFDNPATRRTWAVEDTSGRLIGRISLREIDERKGQSRLGVTFGAPYVGKGLGTEALTLFLDYYFSILNFQVMVLDVAAPNQRAVRCYKRLGFQQIDSDWRDAGISFDPQIIDDPRYAHLRQFFRSGERGACVQFFEMRLRREEWLAQQNGRVHGR
jgi:RimJ/RimL family protein N-acetyltransferase